MLAMTIGTLKLPQISDVTKRYVMKKPIQKLNVFVVSVGIPETGLYLPQYGHCVVALICLLHFLHSNIAAPQANAELSRWHGLLPLEVAVQASAIRLQRLVRRVAKRSAGQGAGSRKAQLRVQRGAKRLAEQLFEWKSFRISRPRLDIAEKLPQLTFP
jgi:hypothetical protein